MREVLKNVASITSGVYSKPAAQGEVAYLQIKDFDENGRLNQNILPTLNVSKKINKNLLQENDILVVARGTKNFASRYEGTLRLAVASSTFLVVRLKSKSINFIHPDYLMWVLNHPSTQNYFNSVAMGSSLASISKPVLEGLELPVPPLEKQHLIVKINQLYFKERQLLKQLSTLKKQMIDTQLLNTAKHSEIL